MTKDTVKRFMDTAVQQSGKSVENLTNEQLLDVISDAIAESISRAPDDSSFVSNVSRKLASGSISRRSDLGR